MSVVQADGICTSTFYYRELLLGLSANVYQLSVSLDLSSNDMKAEGGMVLGSCVANLNNIHGIDLSDNGQCSIISYLIHTL